MQPAERDGIVQSSDTVFDPQARPCRVGDRGQAGQGQQAAVGLVVARRAGIGIGHRAGSSGSVQGEELAHVEDTILPSSPRDSALGRRRRLGPGSGAAAGCGRQGRVDLGSVRGAQPGPRQERRHAGRACDRGHRYPADAALLQELGLRHYRLSVAWPRIDPEGDGALNLARSRLLRPSLIDTLLAEHQVTPWVHALPLGPAASPPKTGSGWPVRAHGRHLPPALPRRSSSSSRPGPEHKFTSQRDPLFHRQGLRRWLLCARERRRALESSNQACHHALLAHGHARRRRAAFGGPRTRHVSLVHSHLPPAPQIPWTPRPSPTSPRPGPEPHPDQRRN